MKKISKKKIKFIQKNYKQLSIEDLAHKTGLKPSRIQALVDEFSGTKKGNDQSADRESANLLSFKTILFVALFFALITTIIYSPSLYGEFVFDDIKPIKGNSLVQITGFSQLFDILSSNTVTRKIGIMSFALNFYFGGFNTFGYHLVNVFIHILNGLILFLLSYTLLTLPLKGRKGTRDALTISFLGSLIWLVHPIQSQAVSYIVQRVTSLSTLFFLLSYFVILRGG